MPLLSNVSANVPVFVTQYEYRVGYSEDEGARGKQGRVEVESGCVVCVKVEMGHRLW